MKLETNAAEPMSESSSEPTDRPPATSAALTSEVLILPDGRVLAHNLTPVFADLLHELNPEEPRLVTRRPVAAQRTPRGPTSQPDSEERE
jgi:hypothetical protein